MLSLMFILNTFIIIVIIPDNSRLRKGEFIWLLFIENMTQSEFGGLVGHVTAGARGG